MKPSREFIQGILATIVSVYGADKFKVVRQTVDLWHRVLDDLTTGELERALEQHVKLQSWPPTPADLRRLAAEHKMSHLPSANDEWHRVLECAARYGTYHKRRAANALKDNAHTISAIRAVGWSRICHTPQGELHYVQRDFEKAYSDAQHGHLQREALRLDTSTKLEAKQALKLIGGLNND